MEPREAGIPDGPDGASEPVDAPARQHPGWLRPGGDFEPRPVAWACTGNALFATGCTGSTSR